MKRSMILGLGVGLIGMGWVQIAPADDPAPPDWPPAKPEAIQAWQDMRFGLFIHWGPVSLTGHEIGWSRGRETPIETYDDLYKHFNPTRFNAEEWVGIAKAAGIKYIVLTTKHHDGFCLWDTRCTDYHIMNSPFKRDVVKELSEAARKQGIRFGAYYSVCDWRHPDFPRTSPGGKVLRGKSDIDAYQTYLLDQIRELITRYGPLVTLWNDVPQEFKGRGAAIIRMARELQPDIVINNRTGDGGDYDTPEQKIGAFNNTRPWESCMTVSAHNRWAWGGADDGVKDLSTCLKFLIGAAGGDGNMLLNVGPTPLGEIAPEQRNRLEEMGAWLGKYGESIYATRGGPFRPGPGFVSTRKDNVIFVHVLKWEGDRVSLPAIVRKIVKSDVLTGGSVEVKQTDGAITLAVPVQDRQAIDTIVRLELDGSAMDLPAVGGTEDPAAAAKGKGK